MAQFWYGGMSSKEFETVAVSVGMKANYSFCMYICTYITMLS